MISGYIPIIDSDGVHRIGQIVDDVVLIYSKSTGEYISESSLADTKLGGQDDR